MTNVTVQVSITQSDSTALCVDVTTEIQSNTSPSPMPISRELPTSIEPGQAIYWTYKWRLAEAETRAELQQGLAQTFNDPRDAIKWLLGADA